MAAVRYELQLQRLFLVCTAGQWHGKLNNFIEKLEAESPELSDPQTPESVFQKQTIGYYVTLDGLDKSHKAILHNYNSLLETVFIDAAASFELQTFRSFLRKLTKPHFQNARERSGEICGLAHDRAAATSKLDEVKYSLRRVVTSLRKAIDKESAKLAVNSVSDGTVDSKKEAEKGDNSEDEAEKVSRNNRVQLALALLAASVAIVVAVYKGSSAMSANKQLQEFKDHDNESSEVSDFITRHELALNIIPSLCINGDTNAQAKDKEALLLIINTGSPSVAEGQRSNTWYGIANDLESKYHYKDGGEVADNLIKAMRALAASRPPYATNILNDVLKSIGRMERDNHFGPNSTNNIHE